MQSAFGTVVLVVCAVGVAGAIAALLLSGRTWDEYGRDHLLRDSEGSGPAPSGSAAAGVEREEEIRQMLAARNARRRRAGRRGGGGPAEAGGRKAPGGGRRGAGGGHRTGAGSADRARDRRRAA